MILLLPLDISASAIAENSFNTPLEFREFFTDDDDDGIRVINALFNFFQKILSPSSILQESSQMW